MALISKPDYTYIWASGGSSVEPSNTKKQTGWTAEVPPFQWENWIQNRQDQFIAHINQRGIPQWDGQTEYEAGGLSYVQGTDGIVYKSVVASGPSTTTQDPTTDVSDTYWTVAFADVGAFLTQAAGDARYLQILNNGSDINNVPVFRSNIGVFGSVIATVAAASTIDLTTSAPDTTQITISGTGVSINGFTVAANRWFVVKMTGASNTLVNSASLVTGRGANIPVVAGDTFLMRSTAANTVEILCGNFLVDATPGSLGQTWQDFTGTRAANTAYTNTTGRTIVVSVTAQATTSSPARTLTVDGIAVGAFGSNARSSCTAIVPPGSIYQLNNAVETVNTIWSELR